MKLIFAALSAICLCACPPGPVSPPPDATDATTPPVSDAEVVDPPVLDEAKRADDFDKACAKLAAVHCPESETLDGGRTCAATMRANSQLYTTREHCLSLAGTAAEVRACCPNGKWSGGTCMRVACAGK